MRTSSQWRELPPYYGKWRSVHKRWESWSRKEVINQVLTEISKDYDGESIMIDATIEENRFSLFLGKCFKNLRR